MAGRDGGKKSRALFADHLECHVHDQLAVGFGEAAEKAAEPVEEFCGFAGTAPLVAGHALGGRGDLRWRFPVVKKLVHGDFEGPGHFFESLDAGDGVAVLDTGDVASLEAGALLDFALRKIFLLAYGSQPVGDNHIASIYITASADVRNNSMSPLEASDTS
jgi:hypothetical protein